MNKPLTRVKFLARVSSREWARYFPSGELIWGECEFTFDRDDRNYDWLVVYDELPPAVGQPRKSAREELVCHPDNTILFTTEPCSIKTYGRHYTEQFGHVVTPQPSWALPHRHRYWQQGSNHWFYGGETGTPMSRERLLAGPPSKTDGLSMVCSTKAQWHTQHARRAEFAQALRERLPELTAFGRGIRPINDKAEAMDAFRYHVVLENHIAPHHWTEKLSDAFLARCLPFYAGAPNTDDYFPVGSVIHIDMSDPDGAAAIIRQAMADGLYEQRLPLIEEARRRVLEDYHLFAVIADIVSEAAVSSPAKTSSSAQSVLLSRHALRASSFWGALYHVVEKLYVRLATMVGKK